MEIFPLIYGLFYSLGIQRFSDHSYHHEESKTDVKKINLQEDEEMNVKVISLNLWLHHLSFAPEMDQRLDAIINQIKEGEYDVLMIQGIKKTIFSFNKQQMVLVNQFHLYYGFIITQIDSEKFFLILLIFK